MHTASLDSYVYCVGRGARKNRFKEVHYGNQEGNAVLVGCIGILLILFLAGTLPGCGSKEGTEKPGEAAGAGAENGATSGNSQSQEYVFSVTTSQDVKTETFQVATNLARALLRPRGRGRRDGDHNGVLVGRQDASGGQRLRARAPREDDIPEAGSLLHGDPAGELLRRGEVARLSRVRQAARAQHVHEGLQARARSPCRTGVVFIGKSLRRGPDARVLESMPGGWENVRGAWSAWPRHSGEKGGGGTWPKGRF